MPRAIFACSILALCVLAGVARGWNLRDIFVQGRIYFVDADCYSRMTRAREVAEGKGLVIRRHDFENWPNGTRPHTTAPMDWLIVAIKRVLDCGFWVFDRRATSVLHGQTLDLAGALVSPLIGVLACGLIGVWAWRLRLTGWFASVFFFAVSPILVHGTLLGRPDHQSLLILLVALALAAELTLARSLSRGSGTAAGVAWALALWVSLYEPLVLFVVVSGFWLLFDRRRFSAPELRTGWIAFAAVLVLAFLIDGWRVSWPDAALRAAFLNWEKTIGELAHLDPRAPLLYRWLGAGILLAPVALAAAIFANRGAPTPARQADAAPVLVLVLLVATFALTVWQLRWGYFLAVVFAFSLPWQFAAARRTWIAWPIFLITLWPLARDWDEKLFPDDYPELGSVEKRGLLRLEAVRLREVAGKMRSADRRPFLAPWWLSPALAYWSGQPGVAGSSHQSLPGIVATAQFFLASDAPEAEHIARGLGVKWIVTDDPERLVATSRALLGATVPPARPYVAHLHDVAAPRERVTSDDLRAVPPAARAILAGLADNAEAAQLGSAAFSCVSSDQFYKLFLVKDPHPTP